MSTTTPPRDSNDAANSVAALGLRRAALRGMLNSPIIDAEDQKGLREELMSELRSIGQSMARAPSRTAVELCAKIDVLSEEYRPDADANAVRDLIGSIRRDVVALTTRPASERSSFQPARPVAPPRPAEPAVETPATEASKAS